MPVPRRNFLIGGMRLSAAILPRMVGGMRLSAAILPRMAGFRPRLFDLFQDSVHTDKSPNTDELIWYSTHYLTAEMPMDRLTSWITPTENFFVRNTLLLPEIPLDVWRLRVTGEVQNPFELTFRDLQQLPRASVTNTLECAGNGRAFFHPHTEGVPWRRGAVGNAVFSGPRLRDLLEKCGLKPGAHHVAFKGLDIVPAGALEFVRSIPITKALEPTTLVALQMNGAPLQPQHGFPARSLVPGWIGSCSIKWLCEIRVLSEEFSGIYM